MGWPETGFSAVIKSVENFDEKKYAGTRNFVDGGVSMLSPYISRGVISTKYVFDKVISNNPNAAKGKFIQELLWRDYFQRLLQSRPELYKKALRDQNIPGLHAGIPIAVLNASTGITAIDETINTLYKTGYIHNHFRMYLAAVCCNIGKYNFRIPAQWMYYHLLDADVASNFASWQWVSGSLTGKSYIANQENINRYSRTVQTDTFLDKTYGELSAMAVPEVLLERTIPVFDTLLPHFEMPVLEEKPTLIYNFTTLTRFGMNQEITIGCCCWSLHIFKNSLSVKRYWILC